MIKPHSLQQVNATMQKQSEEVLDGPISSKHHCPMTGYQGRCRITWKDSRLAGVRKKDLKKARATVALWHKSHSLGTLGHIWIPTTRGI